jgi:hypothetical protein
MRKQPMVSDANAKPSRDPPQNHRDQERLPTEEEQRRQCADVKRSHDQGGDPNDGLLKRSVVRKDPWHSHIVPLTCFDGRICVWPTPLGNTCVRDADVEGLRAFLALPVQKPVEERTGLTKKYDFVLKKGDNDAPATGQEVHQHPIPTW